MKKISEKTVMRAEKSRMAPCPRRFSIYATASQAVPDFDGAVGRRSTIRGGAKRRTRKLEIPGSMLRIAPE
jgi:hypothetical protein